MSYTVYDQEGHVGDLATNQGMEEFMALLESLNKVEFFSLVEEGAVEVSPEFLAAVEALKPPENQDVAKTVTNFKELVKKAKGIVIVTDGVFEDDGSEPE